ncbi:LeuD/DmdB family oxidoreductase small subunit [Streptosporangium sp. NPDC004631]
MTAPPQQIRGRVWVFGDNVNTDLIQPGHALVGDIEQEGRYVFEANRPGWVDLVRPGDVVVAGRNFGTGSSRPAARALRRVGIAALVAESINGLFFRNCVNYGLPALQSPAVAGMFTEGDEAVVDVTTGLLRNATTGAVAQAEAWAPELVTILRAGGLMGLLIAEGLIHAHGEERS